MPQFFLHVHGEIVANDREGSEHPDLDAARESAIRGLRELIAEEVKLGSLRKNGHIAIADEFGRRLTIVNFDDAIRTQDDW